MKSEIKFASKRVKESFKELEHTRTEDKKLYKWICRAFEDLEENAFCGVQISKKLIPGVYFEKYGIDNLWKYDLPKGWRLIYSVAFCRLSWSGCAIGTMKGGSGINEGFGWF